jgi:signal transduction histidine kinase
LYSIQFTLKKLPDSDQLKIINEIPYVHFVSEVEKATVIFNKGIQIALKTKDSVSLGDLVFKLGQLKAYQNKPDESVELSLRAVKIFGNIKNYTKEGIVYGGLGYNLKRTNLSKGLYYMRKAIKLLQESNDSKGINPVYDNYGVLLNMVKKHDSALWYQSKSLRIKKQLKDSVGLGYSYANIANTFAEKNDFSEARKYVDSSLYIRSKIADNYGVSVSYVQKGEILLLENKYQEAIVNFKICADLANQFEYNHLKQYCYQNIALSFEKMKDYKNAYYWKDRFQTAKDSSDNMHTNNRIEELQIQFETEKKEKLLAEAQTDILLKEVEIKNRNYWLVIAFGLAFLLGLIGFLFYQQQKLKNKQIIKENQLKEALVEIENQNNLQEQRLSISKDLHDNIGSQLTFIISALDNLKYFDFNQEKLYPKFDSISIFTRSTITDLRDTIWAMNKEEITFEDLKTRTINFIEAAKTSLLGISFEFNYPNNKSIDSLNSLQGIDVYRIIQEAVHNAIKHAKATKIEVNFETTPSELQITIKDNGIGFDFNKASQGNGMQYMQKRANEIAALFSISALEKGTKVSLILKR